MKFNKKVEIDKYKENYSLYKKFGEKMKTLIVDILEHNNVSFLAVEMRIKDEKSLDDKIQKNKTSLELINDVIGLRVITFVQSDVTDALKVLSAVFEAEEIPSENAKLGTDKVGYRSSHWKLSLPKKRLELVEYKQFKELHFELQIRTVLAHAWAQNSHNQFYKSEVNLPEKIERDFKLLSGLLEIADNEFNRIASEIREYKTQVGNEVSTGKYDLGIDSVTIREFFDARFTSKVIEGRFGPKDDMAEEIISELELMGITNLSQLAKLAEKFDIKIIESHLQESGERTNYCGIARDLMLLHNAHDYFEKAWMNHWSGMDGSQVLLLEALGLSQESREILENHINIHWNVGTQ